MSKYDEKYAKYTKDLEIVYKIWADDDLEFWYGTVDVFNRRKDHEFFGERSFSMSISDKFSSKLRGQLILMRLLDEEKKIIRLAKNLLGIE